MRLKKRGKFNRMDRIGRISAGNQQKPITYHFSLITSPILFESICPAVKICQQNHDFVNRRGAQSAFGKIVSQN